MVPASIASGSLSELLPSSSQRSRTTKPYLTRGKQLAGE